MYFYIFSYLHIPIGMSTPEGEKNGVMLTHKNQIFVLHPFNTQVGPMLRCMGFLVIGESIMQRNLFSIYMHTILSFPRDLYLCRRNGWIGSCSDIYIILFIFKVEHLCSVPGKDEGIK